MPKQLRLCCAEFARMGPCQTPVDGAYFCGEHWRQWDRREWRLRETGIERATKRGYPFGPLAALDRLEATPA